MTTAPLNEATIRSLVSRALKRGWCQKPTPMTPSEIQRIEFRKMYEAKRAKAGGRV